MLVIHDPGVIKRAQIDDFGVVFCVRFGIIAQGEDGFAGIAIPAPAEAVG
jgi:hypothetical protein